MASLSGQGKLDYLIENIDEIPDAWQIGFIEDREARREDFEDLTARQKEIVEEIYDEVTA
jgi:hypothetical protein